MYYKQPNMNNYAQSNYTSTRRHFALGAVVIATKPVHRLQICAIVRN